MDRSIHWTQNGHLGCFSSVENLSLITVLGIRKFERRFYVSGANLEIFSE